MPTTSTTMSALRSLQPVARRLARPALRTSTAGVPRRLLNTDSAPVLYSTRAKAVGARVGHIEGDDLNVDLTMAKALGGTGDKGKTNPEELFAAGYGACFQSAMNAVASSMGTKMPSARDDSVVETTVHLVGDMKTLDMGLRVDMKVKVKGLEKDELEKIVAKAKEVCPYSRATKGNVTTNIEVVHFD
ncbi:OsmC/Ohr family [Microdochium bolleyi]|uniref:OsmC/Ohr family n=1 Tax=Microdochium bolleyi TaxID=196109 RepID=A0A136IKR3_9PEZI|nr:OsmC/Ohr family [Microdochium bolleyi]